jgi:hypothetical protein
VPYVPTDDEVRRLRTAVDRASFTEVERMMWMVAFAGLLFLDAVLIARGGTWIGALASFGAFCVLYWRLRGGYIVDADRELHGVGLRTRPQRAFTALMFRQAITGRNALRPRIDHDPFASWGQLVEKAQASEEPADVEA